MLKSWHKVLNVTHWITAITPTIWTFWTSVAHVKTAVWELTLPDPDIRHGRTTSIQTFAWGAI